jgi:SAM-dependent methyltransferase
MPGSATAGHLHWGIGLGFLRGRMVTSETDMASLASGYVSDVEYTTGYHRELAPSFLDYVLLINGFEREARVHRLRYCDLGCGSGYGTALLAAANPDLDFVGIDFNPEHIGEARAFADRCGLENISFTNADFGTAARSGEPNLSPFDFVALHGVYAWVTPDVREHIHEFLRVKLLPGGVVFVSYNAMPGYARIATTQKMMFEFASRSDGDSRQRATAGLQFLRTLVQKSQGTIERHGALSETYLSHLAGRDPRYLAHEFLDAGWKPFFVTDMMSAMSDCGLSYAGSAAIATNHVELCVPRDLRDTVRGAPDTAMQELIKDCIVGTQFRRDVYAKQPRRLDSGVARDRLRALRFAPMPHIDRSPDTLQAPAGNLKPGAALLGALWSSLDGRTPTGAELIASAKGAGEPEERVWPLIDLLIHSRSIHPLRGAPGADNAESRRLNRVVMELSVSANTHGYLASPVLGSAVLTNLPERILPPLLAELPNLDDRQIAEKAFDRVEGAGQHFMAGGKPMVRREQNLVALAGFVDELRKRRLPRWQQLGITY